MYFPTPKPYLQVTFLSQIIKTFPTNLLIDVKLSIKNTLKIKTKIKENLPQARILFTLPDNKPPPFFLLFLPFFFYS